MDSISPVANAIGWVQFRLRGGWKKTLTTALAFFGIAFVIMVATTRIEPSDADEIYQAWTYFIAVGQAGILLLGGCFTAHMSVRKDIDAKLIDSHRLMPISGLEAAIGYAFGSTLQMLLLGCGALLLGMIATAGSRGDVVDWLAANALIASLAVCLWPVVVLLAMLHKNGIGFVIVFFVACVINANTHLLPPLSFLCLPLFGRGVHGFLMAGRDWNTYYQFALIGQCCMAMLAVYGAARRYYRDDVLPFGPRMAFVPLAGWVILAALGYIYSHSSGLVRQPDESLMLFQAVATQMSAILIGLIAVHSAALTHARWAKSRRLHDPALGPRPLPPWLAMFLTACIITMVPALSHAERSARPGLCIASTAITALSYLVCATAIMKILMQRESRLLVWLILWTVVCWFLPPILDGIRFNSIAGGRGDALTALGACSPIGSLALAAERSSVNVRAVLIGLTFQAALALAWGLLWWTTEREHKSASIADNNPPAHA